MRINYVLAVRTLDTRRRRLQAVKRHEGNRALDSKTAAARKKGIVSPSVQKTRAL